MWGLESSPAAVAALSLPTRNRALNEDDFFWPRLFRDCRFFFRLKIIQLEFGLKTREETTIGGSLATIADAVKEDGFGEGAAGSPTVEVLVVVLAIGLTWPLLGGGFKQQPVEYNATGS